MIDQDKIQEIIDKTDMVGLVSEYVTLTKRGKNYFGLCPFHDDQTPSFSVSPEKKIAKCMSCGEGGNPINFLKKIKNISFDEACQELAERNGVKLDITRTPKRVDENQKYYEINQIAQQFYQHFLFNSQTGKEALAYLHKRGLSMETIKMFGIGLAPKERSTLHKVLKDKGFSEVDAEDIGLIKASTTGYYDLFNNRIMFPIIDAENRVLGFSGRIYYEALDQPKYVNTTETAIYKKGEMLYNLNNAIPYIRKRGRVILCEGQMDVIACTNANIREVICSLGTALTKEQVNLLRKYTKNVVICYDGDNAGIKATGKAFHLLESFVTTTVNLPDGKDPDEYIKAYGSEALEDYINKNQKDIYEFNYFNAFRNRNLENAYDYEATKKDVFAFLQQVHSVALVEKFLRRLSADLRISYEAIFNDYNIYSKQGDTSKNVEITMEDKKNSKPMKAHEKMFLSFIIANKKYYDFYTRELGDVADYLENEMALRVYIAVSCFYSSGDTDQSKLLKFCYQEVKDNIIYDIMNGLTELAELPSEKTEQMLQDSVERFQAEKYRQNIKGFTLLTNDDSQINQDILAKKLMYARSNIKNKRK